MFAQKLVRRPTVTQVRLAAGLVVGVYVTMHLLNHALGLVSVQAQEAARPWVMAVWHSWPGQILLYGGLAVHAALGLRAVVRRRHYRMPPWEWGQVALGLLIPYLLLVHIVNTRGTRILTRIDIDYVYEIANLWVDPASRLRQVALVVLVWGHFALGLHFWLRNREWYRRAMSAVVVVYVMVPLCGLLGFAEVGMTMTARAEASPAWIKSVRARGVPADKERARVRAELKAWVGPAWLGVVVAALAAARARNWLERGRRFVVTYPGGLRVTAPRGMSILEVSRMAGRPHMSVCGGRARCTTCRVRVSGHDPLPEPNAAERRALDRIGAPPGIRLACQVRPHVDVAVHPLLNPALLAPARSKGAAEFGHERVVTVLFLDVRGSTKLAEHRLPYDVVFLLNHFFEEMAGAVDSADGHYSNFTGDGLMALFGLRPGTEKGANAALACAAGMLRRLDKINERLADELGEPILIGVGIHTGLAIIGRMGPPKTPVVTALGDTVNTAARLEGMTKELNAPVVASADALKAAGVAPDTIRLQDVELRGRQTKLAVAALGLEELEAILAARGEQPAEPGKTWRGRMASRRG